MTDDLQTFIQKALERNIPRDAIAAALKKARWRDEEVRAALGAYVDDEKVGIPVPRRKASLSASEAFQYLTIFLCLAICAFGTGTLLFNLIDAWVPDALRTYDAWSPSEVRFALSGLVVALPLYAAMTIAARRAVKTDPVKRESPVRKWLTYLTLFATGSVAIGDLIGLINSMLAGDLSMQFVLKAMVVLCIAGVIFGFYLLDLRRDERTS